MPLYCLSKVFQQCLAETYNASYKSMEILWKSSFNQAYITKLILGKNILIILLYIKYSMHVINKVYAFKSTTFCSYILQARNLMANVYS